MSEMVERVARAIYDALTADPMGYVGEYQDLPQETLGTSHTVIDGSFDLAAAARAAIAALRELPDGMMNIQAIAEIDRAAYCEHHQAMIDEALK